MTLVMRLLRNEIHGEYTKQNIRELQNRNLWFCPPNIQNNARWPGGKANISESAD